MIAFRGWRTTCVCVFLLALRQIGKQIELEGNQLLDLNSIEAVVILSYEHGFFFVLGCIQYFTPLSENLLSGHVCVRSKKITFPKDVTSPSHFIVGLHPLPHKTFATLGTLSHSATAPSCQRPRALNPSRCVVQHDSAHIYCVVHKSKCIAIL